MPSEAQVKNFFVSKKSYVPFSRYSSFCNFDYPMIYHLNMSVEPQLINPPNLVTHQTDRYKQGKCFFEIFSTIWRTGATFQTLWNLATCSNYSITNYVKFPVFHFFERMNKVELRMVNINH